MIIKKCTDCYIEYNCISILSLRCVECKKLHRKKSYKKSYILHREKRIRGVKENYLNKRESKLEYYRVYNKNRPKKKYVYRKKDPFQMFCRNMVHRVLRYKGITKEKRTYEILGYNSNELKKYLTSKLKEGMTWDNYGDWQIDHIISISRFKKDTDIRIVNSLTNLSPEWKSYNLSKQNKMNDVLFCHLYKNKQYLK